MKLTNEVRFHFQRQEYQIALAVGFLSGDAFRPGELAALKKSNLDMDEFWVCLPRPKKGRPEYMPIPDYLIDSLSIFISHLKLDDHLFINLRGSSWTRRDIDQVVKTYAAELGINEVVPRRLRATVGRLLRKNGATLDETREYLRHVELRTTELHYAPDNIEERRMIFQDHHPLSSKNILQKVS
jgi:integrase